MSMKTNSTVIVLRLPLGGKIFGGVTMGTGCTKSVSNGTECDRHCRQGLLCSFISARSEDPHACDSILKSFFLFDIENSSQRSSLMTSSDWLGKKIK
jgi:hypothetical protein